MNKPLISIVSPAYNESDNIRRCHEEVARVMAPLLGQYDYEHLFGDNCSTDDTLAILKEIASKDRRVKVLSYSRNFGAEKSGMTLLRHARGNVIVSLASDLQDPVDMIPVFITRWREGYDVVWGVYENASDTWLMKKARQSFYHLIDHLSEEKTPKNHAGFGLFSRRVIQEVVMLDEQNPYTRGMIASVGFPSIEEPYRKIGRSLGTSKHRLGFLMEFGMNAIISHSLVPLRIATFLGVALAGMAILMAFLYAWIKIFNWNFQAPGATTTIVIVLFFSGVQLFFLGILGEYIGAIHAQVRRKPFVIIREKVNFDEP
jgi:glycosyltransferase involved in cell wall biosynthesis